MKRANECMANLIPNRQNFMRAVVRDKNGAVWLVPIISRQDTVGLPLRISVNIDILFIIRI